MGEAMLPIGNISADAGQRITARQYLGAQIGRTPGKCSAATNYLI
jgi:hypothetical protein